MGLITIFHHHLEEYVWTFSNHLKQIQRDMFASRQANLALLSAQLQEKQFVGEGWCWKKNPWHSLMGERQKQSNGNGTFVSK